MEEPNPFEFSQWGTIFQGHALKGKAIPLPWSFVTYLQQEGIFLAEGNKAFVKFKNEESSSEDNERWQKAAEKQKAEEENNSSRSEDDVKFVDFPALSEEIIRVIGDYGAVFPKLNQKAPVDASWMNWSGKNKCSHPDQVFLLLKSSDIVSDLVTREQKEGDNDSDDSPYSLVLKKFYSLQDSSEFRCVVIGHTLKAISQRYPNKLYPHLLDEKEQITSNIKTFFHSHINNKFPEPDYVLDLYISNTDKVWIVDINKLTEHNLGLFDMDELAEIGDELEYRAVEEETGIVLNEAFGSRLPWDLREMSSTGAMASFLDTIKSTESLQDNLEQINKS